MINCAYLLTINLPSFLWLWKIAAWAMGFAMFFYLVLATSGGAFLVLRQKRKPRPRWLTPLHGVVGIIMVLAILLLLSIGLIGTLGYYGSLGHSWHLPAGLLIVSLTLVSAYSALRLRQGKSWARALHVRVNIALFFAFLLVGLSGWGIVQKYL